MGSIELPPPWQDFGRRWQAWRQRHDRRRWEESWQGRAFRRQRLSFPSPWEDRLLDSRLSLRQGNHLAYLFRHPDGRRALVFAGLFSNAHELEAVFLPEDNQWLQAPVSVAPAEWYALGLERLGPLLAAASALPDVLVPERRRRLWLEGHPNFAHQLLNGLTCLDRDGLAGLGPVLSDGPEAFGPLRELFPGVAWQGPEAADAAAWFELPLSQRPERISPNLRQHLRRHAAARLGSEAQALAQRLRAWKANGGWVLSVSVKARGAVAEGLDDLLAAWLAALGRRGPLPLLLIDGFSPPTGASLATPLPGYRCSMGEVIAAEADQIRALEARLTAAGLAVEVVVCAGRPLLEALHLLQFTDGYFMHQGTVQHKIGWFQETVPGIVHSNGQRNRGGLDPWSGMGETAPLWFPASGCEDLEPGPRGRYRFRPESLAANVDWLCSQIEKLRGIANSPALSLQELEAWVHPLSLRRYQQLIVDQIPFDLEIEAEVYSFVRCRTSPGTNRLELRRSRDGAPFELISDTCGNGFSLEQARPQPLAAALATNPLPSGAPVLRAGDGNFAHFLWNELDPLLKLADRAKQQGQRLPVVQDSDTILDLAQLPGVERLPAEVLEQRPSVHAGAMWVSDAARTTALAALGAPQQAQRASQDPPLLVLGLRGPGRCELRNEEALLIGLIQRLQQRWPGLRIALDGFTFQHNNLRDRSCRERTQAIEERVARIRAACPGVALDSLTGLTFEDYLPRVAGASVYVTHEGTIQHKIGWFYPRIPGICLVAGDHAKAIALWHLAQCEGSSSLEVLPAGLLVHPDPSQATESQAIDLRNQPFEAPEPLPVIDAIEQLVGPHLGQWIKDSLVDCIWAAADPYAAVLAHGRERGARTRLDRHALADLAEAASLTRDPDLLDTAWQRLQAWPQKDPSLLLARLKLRLARREPEDALRLEATTLLPEAQALDTSGRLLLASVLEKPLPELAPRVLQLAALQNLPPQPSVIAALLEQLEGLNDAERERAAAGLVAAGPSLRRPFHSWTDPAAAAPLPLQALVERIQAALEAGQGFSLIRLGDGEGSFLCGRRPDLGGATTNGTRLDPRISERGGQLDELRHLGLIERFVAAVGAADAIGIPDLDQCLQGPAECWRVPAGLALRFGSEGLQRLAPALLAGGWHLHNYLLERGAYAEAPFLRVRGVIAPSLPQALRGSEVLHLALPGERGNRLDTYGEDAHYPVVFERTLERIERELGPGDLVLVGAGILGKIYCDAVRQRGGVAIDIGSVIDIASGLTGTRGEYRLHPYLLHQARRAFAAAPHAPAPPQPPAAPPPPPPPDVPPDVVTAVWASAEPLAALTALGRQRLLAADGSRSNLFELCDAACLTRNPGLLEAAAEQLGRLPADELWTLVYSLRLQIARNEPLERQRATARALLPQAQALDAGSRQLLASLLSPDLPATLLPELSPEALAVLQPQEGRDSDPAREAAIAALLQQRAGASDEERSRAARLYSRLGPSLRRPFQSWDNPQVADASRLDALVERLATARREGRGFGLLRLGDGEGLLLAGQRPDLEGAIRNGSARDAELEARGGELAPEEYGLLMNRFREVVQRADVVGIPDLWQCLQGPEQTYQVAARLETEPAAMLPGGWHLHTQLLLHGAFHRPPFDRITAVIAPALPPQLQGSGVTFLQLPGEDPHWSAMAPPHAHYPIVFCQVLQWIQSEAGPGQLVLVGGGLLGKLYVGALQARGAVAIDIGSVIDLCCGYSGHRGEHRLNPYLAPLARSAFRPANRA